MLNEPWPCEPLNGRLVTSPADSTPGMARLFEQSTEEIGLPPVFRIFGARQVDPAGHDIFRPEARINVQQFPEAFEQNPALTSNTSDKEISATTSAPRI